MRIGGAKAVANLREKIRMETQIGKVGALKGLVDKMITTAKTETPIQTSTGNFYKLPVSSDLLKFPILVRKEF